LGQWLTEHNQLVLIVILKEETIKKEKKEKNLQREITRIGEEIQLIIEQS
jgi:hypothetical protein